MDAITHAAKTLLADPRLFSSLVLRLPLRQYQLAPLKAILESVLNRRGLEFLLVFPRQSGKNEAVAQLLVYLLNLFQRVGGNVVYGASGAGLGLGIGRVEERLNNAWNAGKWERRARPARRCLGKATIVFLSTHHGASVRGQTAHHLLVIDEAQDQVGSHIEAVFTPMRAAHNSTAVYIGTVKLTSDLLWRKKLELEREEQRDGIRRVYLVSPEQVMAENPAYRLFLNSQVRRYGRHHPIIASEYYLEPIDASGGLFQARRLALMRGTHKQQHSPIPEHVYLATLDVAGEDEAATDPVARLDRPARDYTVATVFRVEYPPPGLNAAGPTFYAQDVFVDHGSKHFQEGAAQPALVHRLLAWLEHWQVAHLVADESGVGQGLVSWLAAALGEGRLTGYDFAGTGKKASLGSLFLSLVETGRFRYWTGDEEIPESDGWWFWRQVEACAYEVPAAGRFDRDLRWGVPPTRRTDTPTGPQPTHDDRLLSAALVAEADRLLRSGSLRLGRAESAIVPATDPLEELSW